MKRSLLIVTLVALLAPATAGAAFPGANGKIAFVRSGDIWTMNPDGTGQVNLTNTAAAENNPAWSADGNRIAFDRAVSGFNHRLFVMFADGTGVTQVPTAHEMADPAWSPSGTRLVYSDSVGQVIGAIDTDGTDETMVANLGGDGFDAEWSPDGSEIAFTAETDSELPDCRYDVLVADSAGTDFQNITCPSSSAPPGNLVFSAYPNWSPDGTRIAFTSDDSCPQCGDFLETIARDGTDRVTLPVSAGTPAYSPDGTKIVFGNGPISVVNADGTGVTPITSGTPVDSMPDWQPLNSPGPEADVLATLADSPDPVAAGGILTYTAMAKNLVGPDDASGVTLTLNLPASAFFVSATPTQGSCSYASNVVTCSLGNLPQGSSATVTVTVEPQTPGAVNASASVSATEPDPVPGNNTANAQTTASFGAYPRPKGATPSRFPLVPAMRACDPGSATLTHGPPLTHPSCASPALTSGHLTVGTPDASGTIAGFSGFVKIRAIYETPPLDPGNGDQNDVGYEVSLSDVRNAPGLTDYTGELRVQAPLRLTDRDNSYSGNAPATVTDTTIEFDVPCTATANQYTGATCGVSTTAEALLPGLVTERKRTIWELGKLRVLDGGADGDADTGPNTLFATQGLFVP